MFMRNLSMPTRKNGLSAAEIVLSAPQGYNYYANQQRNYYAQRAAQIQRIQAQRIAAQNRYYRQQSVKPTSTTRKPYEVDRADSENAKFLGVKNQETHESGFGSPCGFRSAADQQKGEGRVFWDLNIHNIYPGGGCGYGGSPGGFADPYPGGGLADPYYGGPVRGPFQNLLGLFLPGGALSGVNRPQGDGSQADDATNSGNAPPGPNFQFLSDSDVMQGITPNQLISGVASTVNNVLQQLNNPFLG
ncbi:uncharacterized protein LOC129945749 [Eupeodes corollae]|uniref:uncharacterized protein LOC129945749 n=1 Tax=Eupeodes corollae TaxID=290404 RepID=UPI002490B97F|nr:uncharacterized protein LOC129945749 [Eupeodes corollae]